MIGAAVLLLVWTRSVPLGRLAAPLRPVVGVLAGSSLYVYLTHWQVLPLFPGQPVAKVLGSFAVGVTVWRLAAGAGPALRWARAAALGRLVPGSR